MCPPGDSQAYSFRPAAAAPSNFRTAAVPSIGGVSAQQQLQLVIPKFSAHTSPAAPSLSPSAPPQGSLRALPRSSSSPSPPIIFCVRGGHVPSASPSCGAATARSLAAPDVAPLLCENCDCTGIFVMETSSACTVRLTVGINCSGWFIPGSPQQSALHVTAGDVFHLSTKNIPFK